MYNSKLENYFNFKRSLLMVLILILMHVTIFDNFLDAVVSSLTNFNLYTNFERIESITLQHTAALQAKLQCLLSPVLVIINQSIGGDICR